MHADSRPNQPNMTIWALIYVTALLFSYSTGPGFRIWIRICVASASHLRAVVITVHIFLETHDSF